jgi:hypothetical protein
VKKKILVLAVVGALALLAVPMTMMAHTEADPQLRKLMAGQTLWVGEVAVWNDATNLYVEYSVFAWCSCGSPYLLEETHLAAATSPEDLPQTPNGNLKPGKFPYKHEDLGGVTTDPYVIPLSELGVGPGDYLDIAAHAVVACCCGDETAWAGTCELPSTGPGRGRGSWGKKFTYQVQ